MLKMKKEVDIKTAFRICIIIPAIFLSLIVIFSTVFLLVYYFTQNRGFLFALFAILLVLGVGFFVMVFIAVNWFYRVFYHGLYEVTRDNLTTLAKGESALDKYPEVHIKEVIDLNNKTEQTKYTLENAFLVTYTPDFSKLDLEYVDVSRNLITFESFKKNLQNLIFLSQSFRNVIIEVFYDFVDDQLSPEDEEYLLNLYYKAFSDYDNSLFTFRDNHRSLLIYLPVIDSFSRINELIFMLIKESTVSSKTIQGLVNIPARYAIVAYPYSSEDSILSDLRYAKRQNKVVNFFLPNRVWNNVGQQVMMHTSMNLNQMSKLVTSLASLHYYTEDRDTDKELLISFLNDMTKYLDIDDAGIILFNEDILQYRSFIACDDSNIFPEGKEVGSDFVDALVKATDEDRSYYFSRRSHANQEVGKMLDYYGITSGFYYIIQKDNQPLGIIYYFNRGKNMVLDAYLRESLFITSLRIAHYFETIKLAQQLDLARSEAEYILAIAKSGLYRVDDDFHITDYSTNLRTVFPNIEKGKHCYEALFGLDKPCNDCMMRTFKKKAFKSKHGLLELSLTLNERKSHNRAVLVERVKDEENREPNLFNKDLLVYSFASLVNSLSDVYYAKGRGYLLLLCIDNYTTILDNQGSEGITFAMRCLIQKLRKKLKTQDIYYYNPTTIAVLFPNIGHADVITKCEEIYEISKEHYLDDGTDDSFNITYLPLAYPRGYATEHDFLRHANDFYYSEKLEHNKDFIYFYDHSISRSASKREFMLSVIENEFSGKMSTSVNLQPMVRAGNKKIYGAEILLRINDVHRNVFFSAQDIARIALQENKTYLITESIVNYVGTLYREHGNSTFKINDFERIAINIDQTYFKDPELIRKIIEIHNAYKLPKDFLSFEIPEEMIPDNLDKIKNFAKELSTVHIIFSCDRYSGKYVGIEKLKELGFKEIKVMKGVIDGIEKDPVKLNNFKDIVEHAKLNDVGISVVGVENEAQYNLLKGIDENMLLQGYYFYKPLTRSDFLSAIISYN